MRNHIDIDAASIGRLWSANGGGAAVVASSSDVAYDSIQAAFDDGYRHIWLAEDVVENNIAIPDTPRSRNTIVIRGMGGGASGGKPRVIDPEDGNPVFYSPDGDSILSGTLADFQITAADDGTRSGPAIDFRDGNNGSWHFKNLRTRAGPVLLGGGFRDTVVNCQFENYSERTWEILGKDVSPSIYQNGTTFAMYGGTFATNTGHDNAVISSGSFSLTGGITFSNKTAQDDGTSDRAALTLTNALNGFVGGITTEVGDPGMRWGNSESGLYGLQNTVFTDVSGSVKIERNSPRNVILATGEDMEFNLQNRTNVLLLGGRNEVTIHPDSTGLAHDITLFSTTYDGQLRISSPGEGYTTFRVDVASSPPEFPTVGDEIIADGTNWDPDGDGNAEKVIYNGTCWVEAVDLGRPL